MANWIEVPDALQYLRPWASKFGLRGLTWRLGGRPLSTLASPAEQLELREAYEAIARRGDAAAITEWCLSIAPGTPASEAKEQIRGLLLLFEQLAEHNVAPFTDGQVRFVSPPPIPVDWSLLPPSLRHWEPWLKKFETLQTEADIYNFVQHAGKEQLRELEVLVDIVTRSGDELRDWCMRTDVKDNPANHEAFQAGWLFLLVDFAKARI